MQQLVLDHIDPKTDTVNCTKLAEAACAELSGYEGDRVPDIYFDCAFEVGQCYELKQGRGTIMGSLLAGFINSFDSGWF